MNFFYKQLVVLFFVAMGGISLFADGIEWKGDVSIASGTEICTDHSQLTSLAVGKDATVIFETATAHTCPITGSGTIIKHSSSEWTMTTSISGFCGTYVISNGVVNVGTCQNPFGSNDTKYSVFVRSGATLRVAQMLKNLFWGTVIHLAGTGANGCKGALEMPNVSCTDTVVKNIELDDDATIYTEKSGLWFLQGRFYTHGHRATFTGEGNPFLLTGDIPSTEGGEIYVKSPAGASVATILDIRSWDDINPTTGMPDGTSPFILTGNTDLQFYTGYAPVNRPLWISGDNNFLSLSGNGKNVDNYSTNNANWAGPIIFTNTTGYSTLKIENRYYEGYKANRMLVASGAISGPGCIKVNNYGASDRVALLAKENTYTGWTVIMNENKSSTLLGYPGSVPKNNYAAVSNYQGFVDLAVGDEYDRWTLDDCYKFMTQANWYGGSSIPRFSSEFTTNGIGPVKVDIAYTNGANLYLSSIDNVKFTGNTNTTPWSFNWKWGKGSLTGPGPLLLGSSHLNFISAAPADSEVRIEDADVKVDYSGDILLGSADSGIRTSHLVITNSVIRSSDLTAHDYTTDYKYVRGGTITAGWLSHGTVDILPGSVISNRLIVGSYSDGGCWTCGGMGAIYQRGGHVVALGETRTHHSSGVGMGQSNSHGYYEMNDGILEGRGCFSVGGYGMGVFAQYGGSVIMTNRVDQEPSALSNFKMASCNQGNGLMYLKKGSFVICPESGFWIGEGSGCPQCEFTLDGEDATFDAGQGRCYIGYGSGSGFFSFNFNRGVYCGSGIQLHNQSGKWTHEDTRLDINFNGGTFKVGGWGHNLFGPDTDDEEKLKVCSARNVVIFKGGMTIDTAGNDSYITCRIRRPNGYGIKSIALGEPLKGEKHIGSPRLIITPGTDGATATAFAHFDSTPKEYSNRCVDAIWVTSPGEYASSTEEVTASIEYKCNKSADVLRTLTNDGDNPAIVLEENDTTGSFTKKGAGTLILKYGSVKALSANNWGGDTIIEGGTLRCGATNAIPVNAKVRISNGAVLDCNHFQVTVDTLEYGPGGGSVINSENAYIPENISLALTCDDIVAGRPVALNGDLDGAKTSIKITGTFPADAPSAVYPVVTLTGGVFVGNPTITMSDLPSGWQMKIETSRIVIKPVTPTLLLLR